MGDDSDTGEGGDPPPTPTPTPTVNYTYKLQPSDSGARGQLNYGKIINCSNIVNITNNISDSLQISYNNKILKTKNASNGVGIQSNYSTNWDLTNNTLKEGYNSTSKLPSNATYPKTDIVSINGTTSTKNTYNLSNFTVLDNINVSSYQSYSGDARYCQTSNGINASINGTTGTPTYALIHTKIPYANFKLISTINYTSIYVNTTNNGIVIDLNDVDYSFGLGRQFIITKIGNKPIILNCEKSKNTDKKAIMYNNEYREFFNTGLQSTFKITYIKIKQNNINNWYWLIT